MVNDRLLAVCAHRQGFGLESECDFSAGMPVKMPADGTSITKARAQPQGVHWHTGVLQNDFCASPAAGTAAGGGTSSLDPCRALRISWDNDTPALVARQPAFHPWQVRLAQ